MTERFLAQSVGEKGTEAIDDCRFQAKVSKTVFAEEVTFSDLSVKATNAQATVEVSGGAENGSTIRIELVKDGDRWKLDRFAEFVIDRARWDEGLYDSSLDEGATPREARCVVAQTRRKWTTAELEREAVRTNFKDVPDPTVLCLSRTTLLDIFEEGFREAVADEKVELPPPVLDCVLNRFTERLRGAQLRALLSAGDVVEPTLAALGDSAARACAREYRAGVLGEQPQT